MIFIFPYDVFFFLCCLGMHHYKYEGRESSKTEKNPTKQILRKTSCIAIKTGKKVFRVEKKKIAPWLLLKKKSHLSRMSWLLQTDSLMISFPWFLSPYLQKEKNQQQVVNTRVISLTVSFSFRICLFCFLFFRFI